MPGGTPLTGQLQSSPVLGKQKALGPRREGWEANRDTLDSFAGCVLMRSKPEEQVDAGRAIAPGEREPDAPAGREEGESLKDKLVAQESRVLRRGCVLVTMALPRLLRAGERGEEMTPSGGWGPRSKQEEAEPAS